MNHLLLAKSSILLSVFLVIFVLERLYAAAPRPSSRSRLVKNLGLWLVTAIATPFVIAPLAALGANTLLWERSVESIIAPSLIVDLLLLDLWVYAVHRAYHEVPLMWRLHEVHHRDEFLDASSALRFHIGEVFFSALIRLIPIAILAIPLSHVIIFETLLLAAAIFHHSNIALPPKFERLLSFVIVTPSIHWMHHHAVRAHTDSNYAGIFSIWDRLFASRTEAQREFDMKIGVEGRGDAGFLTLLLMPFDWSKK